MPVAASLTSANCSLVPPMGVPQLGLRW